MTTSFQQLVATLGYPIEYSDSNGKLMYETFFVSEWRAILRDILDASSFCVELCPGRSTIVRQALDFLREGHYSYALNSPEDSIELVSRSNALSLDATKADGTDGTLDAVVLHHAINDILQYACVATQDTRPDLGYAACARDAIPAVQAMADASPDWLGGALCDALAPSVRRLGQGGLLILNHFEFRTDLQLGYQREFYSRLLEHACVWIEDRLPLRSALGWAHSGLQRPQFWRIMERE